jgi:hypothetical protein
MKTPGTGRRHPVIAFAALAALVAVTSSASYAWASIPHTNGTISSCYNSSGALRVIDAQQGATCAAGETPLAWNGTTITATKWGPGPIKPMTRSPGVLDMALQQPGNRLPAGSWIITATVMIANGTGRNESFRCLMRTRGTLLTIAGQINEWGHEGAGWHQTMTIPGLITLTEPDWVDVLCTHDQNLQGTSVLQIEDVRVIAQRVAAVF